MFLCDATHTHWQRIYFMSMNVVIMDAMVILCAHFKAESIKLLCTEYNDNKGFYSIPFYLTSETHIIVNSMFNVVELKDLMRNSAKTN